MRSRYDLMKTSQTKDERGNNYPDPLTLDLNNYFENPLKPMTITARHAMRPYLITYDAYNMCSYDDIILWLNGISDPTSLQPGEEILIPNLADLRKFYSDRVVKR